MLGALDANFRSKRLNQGFTKPGAGLLAEKSSVRMGRRRLCAAGRAPRAARGGDRRICRIQSRRKAGRICCRRGSTRLLAQFRTNAFTLKRRLMDEYPITSGVEDARTASFFQTPQGIARAAKNGEPRRDRSIRFCCSQFAEPRIHFAINCGSQRLSSNSPFGLRRELGWREHAAHGDAAVSRERVELPASDGSGAGASTSSRIFKMYAEQDFEGRSPAPLLNTRVGVLRFVADHTGVAVRVPSRITRSIYKHLRLGPERYRGGAAETWGRFLFHESVRNQFRRRRTASLREALSLTRGISGNRTLRMVHHQRNRPKALIISMLPRS